MNVIQTVHLPALQVVHTVKSLKSCVDMLNTVVCRVMSYVVCESQTKSAVLLLKLGDWTCSQGEAMP